MKPDSSSPTSGCKGRCQFVALLLAYIELIQQPLLKAIFPSLFYSLMPRAFSQSTRLGLNSSMRQLKQSLSLLGKMPCLGDSGREERRERVKNRNKN